jgi:dihydroneopterin aldolase
MRFRGRHGVYPFEQYAEQSFDVDLELYADLQPAGLEDDLNRTLDYAGAYAIARRVVESTSYRLIEALAEAIAHEVLAALPAEEVVVRVRKPEVDLGGPLDWAGVEIRRQRQT